jgi:hypothetical protein
MRLSFVTVTSPGKRSRQIRPSHRARFINPSTFPLPRMACPLPCLHSFVVAAAPLSSASHCSHTSTSLRCAQAMLSMTGEGPRWILPKSLPNSLFPILLFYCSVLLFNHLSSRINAVRPGILMVPRSSISAPEITSFPLV